MIFSFLLLFDLINKINQVNFLSTGKTILKPFARKFELFRFWQVSWLAYCYLPSHSLRTVAKVLITTTN